MSTKDALPDVEHAFDPTKQDQLEQAIRKLSSEEAAFFLFKLELAVRRRKIQLTGYLVAMLVWLVAMLFALVYWGSASGFVGWVFLLPFALVGVILYAFGRWADRIGATKPPPEIVVKR